jgi:hypothetical protein
VEASDAPDRLPTPQAVLHDTAWPELEHALGPAGDTPAALGDLLAADPAVAAKSLRHLEQTVHHQNSIYSATAPSALFVAAILSDPRVEAPGVYRREDPRRRPLRAVLIDWLGEMADDVSDAAIEASHQPGYGPMDDRPEVLELRALRPVLHAAVVPFVTDPESSVRTAAVTAAARLLDEDDRQQPLPEEEPPF